MDNIYLIAGFCCLGFSIIKGADFSREKNISDLLSFLALFSLFPTFTELYLRFPKGYTIATGTFATVCFLIDLFLYIRKLCLRYYIEQEYLSTL